jgi:hypothetical protein
MRDVSSGGIGMKLQSFPRLAAVSARELHKHAWKLLSERVAFLSYSRRNESGARRLVRELKARGLEVAWNRDELHGGDEWEERLRVMVPGTDVFLLLWSQEASKSSWVHRELSWALGEMKSGGRRAYG